MRVFVTGASGCIGSAVVPELLGAGHQVVGLARSDASAEALAAAGAEVRRGDLDDLDGLRDGRRRVRRRHPPRLQARLRVHRRLRRAPPTPTAAPIETIGDGARGLRPAVRDRLRDRWRRAGRLATDATATTPSPTLPDGGPAGRRRERGRARARRSAACARRSCGSRRPSTATATTASWPTLIDIARDKGVSGYVGDGANRWPAVHRLDAARLFRLALEKAPAGSTLHAVADEGVPIRDIAEVIGRHLDLPVASHRRPRTPPSTSAGSARFFGARQPGLERAHPRAARLAADASRADRRPRAGPLLRGGVVMANGGGRIRTCEGRANAFTARPL